MATKYYPQDTNADTTCDYGAVSGDHDLSTTAGTPTTHTTDTSGISSWQVVRSYQLNIGTGLMASSDVINFSISLNTVTNSDVRIQMWYIDSSCTPVAASGYSSTWTASGTQTGSLTMSTLAGTPERIELRVEAQRNLTHGTRSITIDVQSSNTWIEGPWGGAGGGGRVQMVLMPLFCAMKATMQYGRSRGGLWIPSWAKEAA